VAKKSTVISCFPAATSGKLIGRLGRESERKMYYRVFVAEGRYNILNPSETRVKNSVAIYDDKRAIKSVSVLSDEPIFYDDDNPEQIAEALENWLKHMLFTSNEEKVRDMIQFLRKHSKELTKGRLYYDIERVEEQIKELEEKKKDLTAQLEELEGERK